MPSSAKSKISKPSSKKLADRRLSWVLPPVAPLRQGAAPPAQKKKRRAPWGPRFRAAKEAHRPPADHEEQLNNLIAADRRGDAVSFFMTKMVGAPAIFAFLMRL